jgi:hypothetical protein
MFPLARVWTWTGGVYIAAVIAWIITNRGGDPGPLPAEGILISQGYKYLIVALVAFAALAWIWGAYIHAARQANETSLVPPNMLFETPTERNSLISWFTLVVFFGAAVAGLVVFGVRYSTSVIHDWDSKRAIGRGFWSSRAEAHHLGCANSRCFAMGQHWDDQNKPIDGVWEYLLYVDDGVLLLLIVLGIAGAIFLGIALWRRPPLDIEPETG